MERRFAIVVVFEALRARVKRLCSPARPGIRDIARPRARTRKGAHPCPPRYAASRPERASSRLSERGPAPPPEPLLGELARDGRVAASRVDPLPSQDRKSTRLNSSHGYI